ncbi:MAG: PstC family ABC transporter permease, partial [Solirubrobacteraceae bacterium]
LTLGAAALLIGTIVIAMVVFVFVQAWPIFKHDGLGWLGPGGSGLERQIEAMQAAGPKPPASAYHLNAWPIVYATLVTTIVSVALGIVLAVLSSIFIVELAPARLRRITIPVIRLLASVPSVVYGLIGILVLVPFVGNHLISPAEKTSLQNTVPLTGASIGVAIVILTVMITPIMVALTCEALVSVPNSWREGAVALGVNPVRAILAVTVRAARPAIVAAAVLASARAIGEAVMISMVAGAKFFSPRPGDGITYLFEPVRTLASTIVDFHEGIGAPAVKSALYAFAAVLLFSAFALSLAGYLVKLPLRKYQVRA